MTVVETRVSVWEALAGRAPGQPVGPADRGLWNAVAERLNPTRARPRLRPGIELAHLVSARAVPYVMLRSPDQRTACYLRLTPDELALAELMDGSRTVARLVAEFARICGRLAPDQVSRVVADLAANRMLEELPVDAFAPVARTRRRPWPVRLGRGILAAVRGRRVVLAGIDPLVGFLYRFGGKFLFTRAAAALCTLVAVAGLGLFCWTWARGDQSTFLINDSYPLGALALLALNVFALAWHELGHALAAKHAGRRVPTAGFLVYFGIPSVFVDTTDVWMAGRRARIRTTAAGPAAGLILAGLAQLVGLAFPALGPWVFKLSFAWYLNALFNLNPFLALDGYYLLMDWLELPNLRARGMAWVIARLRRRPPRFGQLDREGRLVALYGMLALVWLVIAGNLAYRIYADRVRGLATGLWRSGWPARLLLAAVVVGLAAPVVYVTFGWLARRRRRLRARLAERRRDADAPRRLGALQGSPLAVLPTDVLATLVDRSRWVHPRTGEDLVFAGAAQPDVYVVVDGALEGRRPGDAGGIVRERVGPGGIVGLASALTGAPAALAWRTAGTTLLAVPASAVAAAVGPPAGPAPAERAELDVLLAEAPAFADIAPEDRLGVESGARSASLPPGAPLSLDTPTDAALVASGVVRLHDGTELGRGALIGPAGDGTPGVIGAARTPVRVWTLPALGGRALVLGRAPAVVAVSGPAPGFGAHPVTGYPPLAAPPGPPPSGLDEGADGRFERKLWWLLLLLLLFALLVSGANLIPGPAWAEMPTDRVLLQVERGSVTATLDGAPVRLTAGARAYLSESDEVGVANRSTARLTFRGGSATLLCAASRVGVGRLVSDGGRPIQPHGALTLTAGRVLADTGTASGAFRPLDLSIGSEGSAVTNRGAARFAVSGGGAEVVAGAVAVDGAPEPPTGGQLSCGDGSRLPRVDGSPTAGPSEPSEPLPSESTSPSASASAVPSAGTSVTPRPSASARSGQPTPTPRPGGPTPPTNPPSTTVAPTTAPPPNRPPSITWRTMPGGAIDQSVNGKPCNGNLLTVSGSVTVSDDRTPTQQVRVDLVWGGFADGSDRMGPDGDSFFGSVGPVPFPGDNRGGTLTVSVVATDGDGASTTLAGGPVTVRACPPPIS